MLLNGYAGGAETPCATALGIVAEGTVGVYAVTCHEHARRRGIGAAITLAAVAAGARAGATRAALQATGLGEPVYRRIGFETVRGYTRFVPL